MDPFATTEDVIKLFRALTPEEIQRAEALLPVVSDSIRQEACKVGKNIDRMVESGEVLKNVLKSNDFRTFSYKIPIIWRTISTASTAPQAEAATVKRPFSIHARTTATANPTSAESVLAVA